MDPHDENLRPEELLAQLGWVRALARSLVAEPDVTDDVLQQVCLLALEQAPRDARTGPRLRAWLATVTRTLVRNTARGDIRRTRRERGAALPEASPSTFDVAAHREALRRLVEAVTSLEEPYYSVVFARYFDGHSVAEIAERHGTSSAAVRQQLTRAREQLRVRLQALLAEDRHGRLRSVLPLLPASAAVKTAPTQSLFAHLGGLLVAKSVSSMATTMAIVLVIAACLFLGAWYGLRETRPASPRTSVVSAPAALPAPHSDAATTLPVQALTATPDIAIAEPTGGATPTAATTGRLVVKVTWATDGTPAADIAIGVILWDTPDARFRPRMGLTNAAGCWELPDCTPGRVAVYPDRANGESVQVTAGETTEVALAIPPGVLVRGLVVDREARPVAGASVCVSVTSEGSAVAVAHTDDSGRFTLRDMSDRNKIGARADGHLPSPQVIVSDSDAHVQDITLRLGGPGADLLGVVLDQQGAPVADALVLVGPENGWPAPDDTNRFAVSGPPPRLLLTDAHGAFAVHDLPRGPTPLAARMPGHSPWIGSCDLEVGTPAQVEIVLPEAAVAAGLVSDEKGHPVAGASVSSGGYGDMDWVETKSGADGRYELTGLALGSARLAAGIKDGGKDETELEVEAGARLQWNPRLNQGLQIAGRVLDAHEMPVPGVQVDAHCYLPGRTIVAQARTDAEGRFTLSNCGDGLNELDAYFPWPTPAASLKGVRPGADDVVLHIVPVEAASAFLTGHILDAHGLVPELTNVIVSLVATGRGDSEGIDPDTGEFRFGPLVPGEWDLVVLAKGHARFEIGRFTLVANETREVGAITLPAPSRIVLRARLGPGVTIDRVFGYLHVGDSPVGQFLHLQEGLEPVWISEPLAPGDYVAKLQPGSGGAEDVFIVPVEEAVHLEAGQEAHVELYAERGASMTIRVVTQRESPPPTTVIVSDATGAEVLRRDAHWNEPRPGSIESQAGVSLMGRPGAYTLKVESEGKLVHEQDLSLPAGVNIGPEVLVKVP